MHYLQLIRGDYKGFKDSSGSKKDNTGIFEPSSPTKLGKNPYIFITKVRKCEKENSGITL